MPIVPVQFGTSAYKDRSLPVASQQLLNMYVAQKPEGAKARVVLQAAPGLKVWTEVGDGPIRGMHRLNEQILIVVSGDECYRVNSGGVSEFAGVLNGSGNTAIAGNGTYAIITQNGNSAWVSLTGFSSFEAGFRVGDLTFQDGYIIASEQNTERFYVSSLSRTDPPPEEIFNLLDFAIANALPDNVVAVENANRNLWVFGKYSTQVYYNSGGFDFPFARIQNGIIYVGALSRELVCSLDDVVFWVGNDYRVYISRGMNPSAVSTDAIENLIEHNLDKNNASSFAYKQYGQTFFVLNFTEASLVYCIESGLWHERQSNGYSNANQKSWRAAFYADFNNKRLVGGRDTNKLYELDLSRFSDDGQTIQRVFTSEVLHAEVRRMTMGRFILDIETGMSNVTSQTGSQIMLQWSDDGGKTYSNEHWRSVGKTGEYIHRVTWNNLGSFRSRIMRIMFSDAIPITAISAWAEIEPGEP